MTISVQSTTQSRTLNPPKLENTSSIFTVSREDIFDYKRCPKIVAIKTYRTTRTKKLRPEVDQAKVPIPNIVGQIGEAATQLTFSGNDEGGKSLREDNLVRRKTPEKGIV
jgi:hypothetical protein